MGDTKVLEAVERYIRGEMNPDERLHFENLRKSNGEIDELVVEHTLFMQQMNRFGNGRNSGAPCTMCIPTWPNKGRSIQPPDRQSQSGLPLEKI